MMCLREKEKKPILAFRNIKGNSKMALKKEMDSIGDWDSMSIEESSPMAFLKD